MTKDTSGAAFPFSPNDQSTAHMAANGMSLRDWFAGQALVGILANTARMDNIENTAEGAFAFADAMLAARALTTGENDD